ncbi:MAG TPA: DnaA/Hda family protein, partial [Candidatus Binataceae bacterium]|nr:DnaA/Hda family protein [Candidatus Binataceae bacterium]
MRDELGQVGFETWIGPLSFVGQNGSTVTIQAPNRFFRDWINDRYAGLLRQALSTEAGTEVEVRLTLGDTKTTVAPPPSRPSNGKPVQTVSSTHNGDTPRSDRHPQLNPRYTFTEFVVGSANQFAHAGAQAVANQPGEKYNPLFIYGGVGLGKTHLVTAIGHHIYGSGDRPRKVLFMPAEIFMNELI